MKRVFVLLLSMVCTFALIGCGNKTISEVNIDYGTSSIYTEEDMNAAIELIKREFRAVFIHQKRVAEHLMQMKNTPTGNGGWHVRSVASGN